MPAEHAILGLLSLTEADGTGYGYDLAKHFADGQPLAEILRLESGMLYHHLKKLERAGWVEAEVDASAAGARPPRRVYRLTDQGRWQLGQWLSEPVAHTREIRLEFLVKLYFARRLNPERADVLLAEQHETLHRIAESLSEQIERLARSTDVGDVDGDDAFTRVVLELRRSQTAAAMTWLASLPAKLGRA